MDYFKRPRMSEQYVFQKIINIGQSMGSVGLFGICVLFALFALPIHWYVIAVCVFEHMLCLCLLYLMRSTSYDDAYEKEVCKKVFSFMDKVTIVITDVFTLWLALALESNPIIVAKNELIFSFSYICTTISILTWMVIIVIYLLSDALASEVTEKVYCIIAWKLSTKFPMTKSSLMKCGVKTRRDCALYYCWVMHHYGQAKSPVLRLKDLSKENVRKMETVFYEFPEKDIEVNTDNWRNSLSFTEAENVRKFDVLAEALDKDNFFDILEELNCNFHI